MKQERVFAIMANADQVEGRGASYFTGIAFTWRVDALAFVNSEMYANKWGVMGTKGDKLDVREMTIAIFDSYIECKDNFESVLNAEARERALAKLTPEDRKVLGLI